MFQKRRQQKAIEKVVKYYLIDKKPPGIDPVTGKCTYYNNGTMCAIGFIAGKKVAEKLEKIGCSIGFMRGKNKEITKLSKTYGYTFLVALQNCHDLSAPTNGTLGDVFGDRLRELCHDFDLKCPAEIE